MFDKEKYLRREKEVSENMRREKYVRNKVDFERLFGIKERREKYKPPLSLV